MSSDAAPDRDVTADQFISRGGLLADLGRYDEAAAEIGYAVALEPVNSTALILLARVWLAASRPAEALDAADRALAVVPDDRVALGARAMALTDLRRFTEAAEVAQRILASAPDDAHALSQGAALLSESRNGQTALDAAWRAVELAPDQAHSHLVLGLVAARLHQFQLAERAYRKALDLDPELADAHADVGVVRLEHRRYSAALADLADAAVAAADPASAAQTPTGADLPPSEPSPLTATRPGTGEGGLRRQPRQAPSVGEGIRVLLHVGSGYGIVAPILVACAVAGDVVLARFQAVALGIIGLGLLAAMVSRIPGRSSTVLKQRMRVDRALRLAVYVIAAAPLLVLSYAVLGSPWVLAGAVAAGATAMLVNAVAVR